MPIYEYKCARCGAVYEVIQIRDDASPACPSCGGQAAERVLSATATVTGKAAQESPAGGSCCGSTPGARGCVPGSCCGRTQ